MGKPTRDDRYQQPDLGQFAEHLIELQEVHGIRQSVRRIYTHLFDLEKSETQPIYAIMQDEDNHFWPQWVRPTGRGTI